MQNVDTQKHCALCSGVGPFSPDSSRSDGLSNYCKRCANEWQRHYGRTPKGKAAVAWQSILKRANNRNGRSPSYAAIGIEITQKEFMAWAIPAFTKWMNANSGLIASIHRINNAKAYTLGNLMIIERGENARLSPRNKNLVAPDGMAWCGTCKQYLAISQFNKRRQSFNGVSARCKVCNLAYTRQWVENHQESQREYHRIYLQKWRENKRQQREVRKCG